MNPSRRPNSESAEKPARDDTGFGRGLSYLVGARVQWIVADCVVAEGRGRVWDRPLTHIDFRA